jgi:hypothetical protein
MKGISVRFSVLDSIARRSRAGGPSGEMTHRNLQTHGLKFQGHNGSQNMFPMFWHIGVLISITSYNPFFPQEGDTHPLPG